MRPLLCRILTHGRHRKPDGLHWWMDWHCRICGSLQGPTLRYTIRMDYKS